MDGLPMRAKFEEYQSLLKDRPEKFSEEQVNYRDSETILHRCVKCVHYYERQRDAFGVCEIFRSEETDSKGVDPDYVCDFFTSDGEHFPLLKKKEQ
jgi:hypothetical protein